MHVHCDEFIQFNYVQIDNDEAKAMTDDKSSELKEDLEVMSVNKEPEIQNNKPPQKGITARITKIKLPGDEQDNNEAVKIIEIQPNKFVQRPSKKDRELRNPGPDKELGRLSFRIEYHLQRNELHIGQIYGEGLRKKNSQAILNPFIVIYIWPDNMWPVKTGVIKKTNSPRWEEVIVYEQFDLSQMISKALHFKIQTWQQFKPNEVIGHVVLPLRIIKDLNKGLFEANFLKNLQPELQINRGSIKLVLIYKKEENDIIITILKAHLIYPNNFIADQCQVFVKVSVFHPNFPKIQYKFTSIQRGSFQPIWRENLTFKVESDNISKLSVIISIREEGFSKEGKPFAYVELGPEHSETNNTHLRTVLKRPYKMITQWHQLISNIV